MKNQTIKRLIMSLCALAFIVSYNVYAQDNTDSKIKEVTIKTSAQCEECKARIEKAVNKLSGVEEAILDVETKDLTVKYNSEDTDVETIRKAVNKAGYDADDQPADKKAYNKLPKCCQKGGHE